MPDPLASVPSLDRIAADPGRAADLPLGDAEALIATCLVAQCALFARLLAARSNGRPPDPEDRLLTVEEAAARLGCSPDYLYRRSKHLPFAVRLGRGLRFSSSGIDTYIKQRRGR